MRVPKLTIAATVAGLLAGLVVSFAVTPRYVAKGVMQLTDKTDGPQTAEVHRRVREDFERTKLEALDAFPTHRDSIRIDPVGKSDSVFMIQAADSDRTGAQMLANSAVSCLIDRHNAGLREAPEESDRTLETHIAELQARLAALEARVGVADRKDPYPKPPSKAPRALPVVLDLLDAPTVHREFPNRLMFALSGGLLGLMAGVWRGFR